MAWHKKLFRSFMFFLCQGGGKEKEILKQMEAFAKVMKKIDAHLDNSQLVFIHRDLTLIIILFRGFMLLHSPIMSS